MDLKVHKSLDITLFAEVLPPPADAVHQRRYIHTHERNANEPGGTTSRTSTTSCWSSWSVQGPPLSCPTLLRHHRPEVSRPSSRLRSGAPSQPPTNEKEARPVRSGALQTVTMGISGQAVGVMVMLGQSAGGVVMLGQLAGGMAALDQSAGIWC